MGSVGAAGVLSPRSFGSIGFDQVRVLVEPHHQHCGSDAWVSVPL